MRTLSISVVVGILLLWLATGPVLAWCYPDLSKRGQFGDSYGALNALFSGLALAGVVLALVLQRDELRLQREELAETRRELARSAAAQETSHAVLRSTMHAQAFGVVREFLQADPIREARRRLFQEHVNTDFSRPDGLQPSVRKDGEAICQTYDSAGLMVRHGLLPAEHLALPYASSLLQCWKRLEPLVLSYRRDRHAPELWGGFEELVRHAARFRGHASTS